MFEVGFTEIILICGLALIVLGPQKLPKLASQLGRWVGRARAMARQLRDQLDQEVNFEEQQRPQRAAAPTPSTPPPRRDVDGVSDPHAAPAFQPADHETPHDAESRGEPVEVSDHEEPHDAESRGEAPQPDDEPHDEPNTAQAANERRGS